MTVDRTNGRWLAVYGAAVSEQVFERIHLGMGPPDEKLYQVFVEEATAIADASEEAWAALEASAVY